MNKYEHLSHSERLRLCSSFIYGVNQPSRFMPKEGSAVYCRLQTYERSTFSGVTKGTTRVAEPLFRGVRETVDHLERIRRMDLKPEMRLSAIASVLDLSRGVMLTNLGMEHWAKPTTEELEQQLDYYLNYAINKTNDVLRSAGY